MNMRRDPKVTVLMSVYNGERYLNEAVDSILSQTFTDFEFLIIDDASTDRTPEILRGYDDPRIRIVTNEENLGLTKSLNKGLALARGEYIARMDADDISLPKRLEKEITFLDAHPNIALVGTSYQKIDHEGNSIGKYILPTNVTYQDLLKDNFIIHGSVIVRCEVLELLSGYNEFFKKCQDYALWLQIAKICPLQNIDEILYKLRIHRDSVSENGNESIFYHILAVKIAEDTISDEQIYEIHSSGIRHLQNYFSNKDWIYYHISMADRYRSKGDIKKARHEYLSIFYRDPSDICNLVNLVRSLFLGNKLMNMTTRFYITVKYYINLI